MTLTKLVGVMITAFAISATSLNAQNTDDSTNTDSTNAQDEQIQQLEKELRILELQKQIQQVKQGGGNTQSTNTSQNPLGDNNSKESSGFMLGAGLALGYTITPDDEWYGYTTNSSRLEYGGELLLGYKWFFGSGIFGMRLYADYNFLFSSAGINPVNAHNGSLNYDLMFNFNKSQKFKVGLFFGLHTGFGATNYKYDRICASNQRYEYINGNYTETYDPEYCENPELNFTFGGNFGFRFVFYDKHALELVAQPRYDIFYGGTQVLGFVRYIYTFQIRAICVNLANLVVRFT